MNQFSGDTFDAESKKIVFIITSVIHPSPSPLSYSPVRSVFSASERASQTLKTIDSVRLHYKNARICLIETGLNASVPSELLSAVDKFIFLGDMKIVRYATDSRHKGFGEAIGLIAAYRLLKDLGDFYFKISGRYFLTDNFNPRLWEFDNFIVRKYSEDISTRLYAFPKSLFFSWQFALIKSLPWLLAGKQIEHVLPKFLPNNCFKYVDNLGVAGAISPNGKLLEE